MLTIAAYAFGALIGIGSPEPDPGSNGTGRSTCAPNYWSPRRLSVLRRLGLTAPRELAGPFLIAGVGWVLLAAAVLARRKASLGEAALEAWAGRTQRCLLGAPGRRDLGRISGHHDCRLANALFAAPEAVCIHLMRRDAPVRQRHRTSWVDQSALLALAVGLLLHFAGPAPGGLTWCSVSQDRYSPSPAPPCSSARSSTRTT